MARQKNILPDELKAQLDQCKTQEDLFGKDGLAKELIGNMVTYMMEKELESKLGYPKNGRSENSVENRRNGYNEKTVRSSSGDIQLRTPRDRTGEFEPELVKKYQKDISFFDDKIISMYAKGMTVSDIQSHVEDAYGVELSTGTVSHITNKVMERAKEWQSRPLDAIYAVVFFDAIHYKVRDRGKIVSKAAYTCLGVNLARIIHETEKRVKKFNIFDLIKFLEGAAMKNLNFYNQRSLGCLDLEKTMLVDEEKGVGNRCPHFSTLKTDVCIILSTFG